MIAALAGFLSTRSPRERGLLLALVMLGLPLAFGALVVLPLLDARAVARADLATAGAQRDWYAARQAEIALVPVPGGAAGVAGASLGQIEAALLDAGLRDGLERLAATASGGVELVLADVAFAGVMPWIEGIGSTLGLKITTLALVQVGPGRVDLRLGLDR